MKRQDYLDNLEQFLHEPEKLNFSDEIIPVAMWLRNFMPGDDDNGAFNKSSAAIRAALCDIVDVSLNDISRLMVLNGYSLGGTNQTYPEWLMQPIGDEDDDQ
ncbi:MAG: hypothetical protein IJM66_09220 [Muribaculaceae bacterium]|nr:hypothetical protein [Muribaculaceae bacterium]MBQ6649013.1 hypothetical protein [Muribaculaceae bacterium]